MDRRDSPVDFTVTELAEKLNTDAGKLQRCLDGEITARVWYYAAGGPPKQDPITRRNGFDHAAK